MQHYKKQTGAVMLWSLVILLVLLMMGVTSMRLSGLDTRIAGNEMHRMLTFQAAESSITRVAKLYYLDMASKSADSSMDKSGMTDPISMGSSGVDVQSDAKIELVSQKMDCPVLTGLANSMDASAGPDGMDCQLYRIDARSRLPGSGARGRHSTGVVKFTPSIGG